MTRHPSAAQLRQLRSRDRERRFPGCGTRQFVQAHHIRAWSQGEPTDLDNLVLICSFHHRLVREYGWRLRREPWGGTYVGWSRRRPLPGGAGRTERVTGGMPG